MRDYIANLLTRTGARAVVALVLVLLTSVFVVRATELVGQSAEPTPTPTAAAAEVTPSPTPADTPTATPSPAASPEPVPTFKLDGGGAKNIVLAKNQTDGRFLVRGRLDLNRVAAAKVAPVNIAYALGLNCTNCNTIAIAGQITLYKRGIPNVVAPQNAAVAVNGGCTGCFTGAWAIQFLIPIDDMNEVPRGVDEAVRELDAELRGIERDAASGSITVLEALNRLELRADSLLDRFRALGQDVRRQLDTETNADTPSPYPTPPPEESAPPGESPALEATPAESTPYSSG
jgi:hypothetical protein